MAAKPPVPPPDLAWQLVLRRLPALVWTTDASLCITSAGGSAFGELALNSSSLVGKSVAECFADQDDAFPPVHAHREALAGRPTSLEHVWNRKAFRLYIEPLQSPSGDLMGCVGMAIDVTPRKQTEQLLGRPTSPIDASGAWNGLAEVQHRLHAETQERRSAEQSLRATQEQFLQLAASIDTAFWIFDLADSRVIYLSPGYERIWGLPNDDALTDADHAIWRNIHEDDATVRVRAQTMQRLGQAMQEEFRIHRPDGNIRWIRARTFPIHGPAGKVERIAGIAEDVTRRKQEEQATRRSERLATLGNFAAGIAHEVNNPLGAALAATQGALRMLPARAAPRLRDALTTTLASVRRCSEIVKSLLRFCREEPGVRHMFDLAEVTKFAESITRTYAADHRAKLTLTPSAGPIPITANPIEIEIVLVNLLRNAVESEARCITLSTAAHEGQVEILVADDGRGIAEADADRLCDPFFTTRRGRGGTGLGLSIVHSIVQEHGGRIDFRRNPRGGTIVAVMLPQQSEEIEHG